jgi:predicted ribosomally synthesized peptide with nif11-like leader
MSVDSVSRAKEFVQYLATNPDLRTSLLSTEPGHRRAIMQEAGFGDVDAQTVADVLESGTGELSDEQLKSVQGGLIHAGITWD